MQLHTQAVKVRLLFCATFAAVLVTGYVGCSSGASVLSGEEFGTLRISIHWPAPDGAAEGGVMALAVSGQGVGVREIPAKTESIGITVSASDIAVPITEVVTRPSVVDPLTEVTLRVPPGEDRVVLAEARDGSGILLATCSVVTDVAAGATTDVYAQLEPVVWVPALDYTWERTWGTPFLNAPYDVDVDEAGDVYVMDSRNNQVRIFDSEGNSQDSWGSGLLVGGQFDYPMGIAVSTDYVYIANTNRAQILKFTKVGQFVSSWGSYGTNDGQFDSPIGVAVDPSGNVYVSDHWNHRVQKFTGSGVHLLTFGSEGTAPGQFTNPMGIDTDAAGNVWVADRALDRGGRIQQFDGLGTYLQELATPAQPADVSVSSSGDVYVVCSSNPNLWTLKFSPSGTVVWDVEGLGGYGIASDSAGGVYVAKTFDHCVEKLDGSNGAPLGAWFDNRDGEVGRPDGLAVDASGNVYVADTDNDRIQKFTSDGAFLLNWGSSGPFYAGNGTFNGPYDVDVSPSGRVFVCDRWNRLIQRFDASGGFVLQWGGSGTADGQFNSPRGVACDGEDFVYVADTYNDRMQKFDQNGGHLLTWGSSGTGDGQFSDPAGVAVDASGNVYVADELNNRVQAFDSMGNHLFSWGSQGYGEGQLARPTDIAIDPSGAILVLEGIAQVECINSSGEYLRTYLVDHYGHDGDGILWNPRGLAVDLAQNLFIADSDNSRVQRFGPIH